MTSGNAKNDKNNMIKFTCPSVTFAKHLWRHLLSQQAFYTESSASSVRPKFSKPRIPILSRGSTFRYSSIRVLNELEKMDAIRPVDLNRSFARYGLPRQESRSYQSLSRNNKFNTIPSMHPPSQRPKVIDDVNAEMVIENQKKTNNEDTVLNVSAGGDSSLEKEKVTTFTIHLSRTDPSSTDEDETTVDKMTTEFERQPKQNGDVKQSSTSPSSIQHSNQSSTSSSSGLVHVMVNAVFTTLLLLMLLVAILVCVFETADQRWTDTYRPIAYARHALYEPIRSHLMARFG